MERCLPTTSPSEVLVLGSANMDRILRVPYMPAASETLRASAMSRSVGGKGLNQAVAAARLGASVRFCGAVGDDSDGQQLLRVAQAEGVACADVVIVERESSGAATVLIDESLENNRIITVEGANGSLPMAHAIRFVRTGAPGTMLVLQGEISPDIVDQVILEASTVGLRVILNLAPYRSIERSLLELVEVLVVNEAEGASLFGSPIGSVAEAKVAALSLAETAPTVVITLGSLGAVWAQGDNCEYVPAPTVPSVVDTAGAGDAFVGALAAALANSRPLFEATREGVLAGSYAVKSVGTVPSYPTSGELLSSALSSTQVPPRTSGGDDSE